MKQKTKSTIAKRFRVRASGTVERTRMHRQHHRNHLTNRQKAAGKARHIAAAAVDRKLVA